MSPYQLIQEELKGDPWKMLIACMMLNQTSYKQVRPLLDTFFSRYPDPASAAAANHEELAGLIKTLGFQNRRAKRIIKFSQEYMEWDQKDPAKLHGIGPYGRDSYEIFVRGNITVYPTDKKLQLYLQWVNQNAH